METTEHFTFVGARLAEMLNQALTEPLGGIFKRSPQVVLGGGKESYDSHYHLHLMGREFVQSDRGTFPCPMDDEQFLIFRFPALVRTSFELRARGLSPEQLWRAEDRLMAFFFENRMMDPILPEGLRRFPALWDRLRSRHAELQVREPQSSFSNEFRFAFDYAALYHSGTFIRQDARTKARAIDYANENNNQRSLS